MSSITVSATKPSKDSRIGIGLRNIIRGVVGGDEETGEAGGGRVYISRIQNDSIFAGTELRQGMIVESVNGINCTFLTAQSDVGARNRGCVVGRLRVFEQGPINAPTDTRIRTPLYAISKLLSHNPIDCPQLLKYTYTTNFSLMLCVVINLIDLLF